MAKKKELKMAAAQPRTRNAMKPVLEHVKQAKNVHSYAKKKIVSLHLSRKLKQKFAIDLIKKKS